MGLSLVRYVQIYQAIKEEHEKHGYPIGQLCKLGHVSRTAYYKWLHSQLMRQKTYGLLIRLKRDPYGKS